MGYPIYHSQYTAAQIEASIGKTPRIKAATRTWEIWDISTSAYVDTGVSIDTQLFVDPTLTESGYAADAKVTGDKIGELESAINVMNDGGNIDFYHGNATFYSGYYNGTPEFTGAGTVAYPPFTGWNVLLVHVIAGKTIKISGMPTASGTQSVWLNSSTLTDIKEAAWNASLNNGTKTCKSDWLALSGYAIDASTVKIVYEERKDLQDQIDTSNSQISNINNEIDAIIKVVPVNVLNGISWEIGSLNASTGANMASTTRIRTIGYIDLNGIISLDFGIETGYKYCVYLYNPDKTINPASLTSWQTKDQTIKVASGVRYMRVLIANTSDTTASLTYSQELTVEGLYSITKSVTEFDKAVALGEIFVPKTKDVSTLMSQRYGVVIAFDGLTLVKGRTYTVSLTPQSPVDLQSDSNGIAPIVYKSDDTVGIRLGSVDTVGNVFSSKWTKSFEPESTLIGCKFGAYVVLPAAADYTITFTIEDTTEEGLVSAVKKLESGTELIPDYYSEYIDERLETIWDKDVAIANNGDSFIFITDVHETNSFNSPALAKYIIDKSAVGRLMYGGDYINQPTSKALAVETLQKSIAKLRVSERAVFLEGNHETNPYGTGQLTPGEVYGIINKRIERYVDTGAKNYYYFDNESQKIRYIILDTGEDGNIDATQEAWVASTASALASGWVIIFLSHMAVYTSGKDVRDNVQKYDVVDKVLSAISGISAKVACWVCGHTHKDFSYATTNFPIISVTCDANGNQASTYTSDNRDIGTTNEQAFDVFHVNTDSQIVYATRIGGGQYNVITTEDLTDNDRQWNYT